MERILLGEDERLVNGRLVSPGELVSPAGAAVEVLDEASGRIAVGVVVRHSSSSSHLDVAVAWRDLVTEGEIASAVDEARAFMASEPPTGFCHALTRRDAEAVVEYTFGVELRRPALFEATIVAITGMGPVRLDGGAR